MWANDELKHYDYDEIELRHYGVKGMKWRYKKAKSNVEDAKTAAKNQAAAAKYIVDANSGKLTDKEMIIKGAGHVKNILGIAATSTVKNKAYDAAIKGADAYDKAASKVNNKIKAAKVNAIKTGVKVGAKAAKSVAKTAAKTGKTAAKVTVKVKKAQAKAKVKKTAKDLKKAVKKKLKR